jgi:hypothetical protein
MHLKQVLHQLDLHPLTPAPHSSLAGCIVTDRPQLDLLWEIVLD